MNNTCPTVIPGLPLSPWQKAGLSLVARLQGGRDIVLAIDVTPSVNPNEEGKLHRNRSGGNGRMGVTGVPMG